MTRSFFLAAGFAALGTVAAQAADLPVRPYTKAPVLAPTYDWSGFYLGVNVGLGLGRDLSNITNTTALQSSTAYLGPIGAIGGAQAGYNWQTGDWVFGLETDIQGSAMRDDGFCGRFCRVGYFRFDQKLDWFGTTRARVGLATGPVLSYVTGGVAYGGVQTDAAFFDFAPGTFSMKGTRTGWTVGSGVEASLGGAWTAKIEYLYVDLGTQSANFTAGGFNYAVSSEIREHIFRAGLNYRLGANSSYAAAPVANWSGFYVGANVGGATARNQTRFADTAAAPIFSETYNLMPDGYVGGLQAGYNWQSAAWVLGIEADFQGSTQRDNKSCMLACFLPPAGPQQLNVDQRMNWFGTVRGRVGYSVGQTLFYGTGGLAYGNIKNNVTELAGPPFSVSFDHTKTGWTAGAGIETPFEFLGMFGKGWTTKTEYLYVDLGRVTDNFTNVGINQEISSRVTEHIFRGGINYHFNTDVVTK